MKWATFCKIAAKYDATTRMEEKLKQRGINVVSAKCGDSGFNAAHQFDNSAPCYMPESRINAEISSFFARNACRMIERIAEKHGIDLNTGETRPILKPWPRSANRAG